jgi:hypothetical protein
MHISKNTLFYETGGEFPYSYILTINKKVIYVGSVSSGNHPTGGNYANHDLGHWISIQWLRRELGSFFR